MLGTIHFGLFDWLDRQPTMLWKTYHEHLQLLTIADQLGFFCYHLAEHHATPAGMAPSPNLFLAAAAQCTRKIRLGPLCYILPLYHPLRLVEEICMLDHLCNGRLDIGIGRGVSPHELAYHGVEPKNAGEMFQEAVRLLQTAFLNERLTYQGNFFHYQDVPREIVPYQQPYPPLWYPTSNSATITWLGEQGFNTVLRGSPNVLRGRVTRYWQVWQAHSHEPDRLNAHVLEPKVGITAQVFIAETDEQAEKVAREAHRTWFETFDQLWSAFGQSKDYYCGDFDAMMEEERMIVGSPARVRQQIARLIEITKANYFVASLFWGNLTYEHMHTSLLLFAKYVMPEFMGRQDAENTSA